MKRKINIRNRYLLLGDVALILVSVLGSYAIRLELSPQFFDYLESAVWMIAISMVIKPITYFYFGLYRRMWAYASVQELKLIALAVSSASVFVSVLMIAFFSLGVFTSFPRSVLVIDWILSVLLVGGLRFALRVLAESQSANAGKMASGAIKQALIIGAGDGGALVVRELQKNPQLNLDPIGFLDDNPAKQRQQVYGVPVVGTINDLANVLDSNPVDEVIIAIPSAPGRVMRVVADICRLKGVPFRAMPGI